MTSDIGNKMSNTMSGEELNWQQVKPEEKKEEEPEYELRESLVGTWMIVENVDSTPDRCSYFDGIHYLNINSHSDSGIVKGYALATFQLKDKLQERRNFVGKKRLFTGIVTGSRVFFHHRNVENSKNYTCAYDLKINQYSMDGVWYNKNGAKGVCKWIKAKRIAK